MMEILSQELGWTKIILVLTVALAGDAIDYVGGWVPWFGEGFDIAPAVINAFLLKNPLPLLGAGELVSLFPPLALLDFLPTNLIALMLTLIRIVEKNEGRIIRR